MFEHSNFGPQCFFFFKTQTSRSLPTFGPLIWPQCLRKIHTSRSKCSNIQTLNSQCDPNKLCSKLKHQGKNIPQNDRATCPVTSKSCGCERITAKDKKVQFTPFLWFKIRTTVTINQMYKFDNKHVFVTLIHHPFKWGKYTVRKLFVFTEGCCSSSKDLTSGVHFYILSTISIGSFS